MTPRSEQGLTIIEILVVISISLAMIVSLIRFIGTGFPISKITYLQTRSTETARLQLKRLALGIRELRQSDSGDYALEEALPQRIIFYANIDGDALTERVRYELTGTDLVRGVIKPQGNPLVYPAGQETTTVVARYIRNGTTPLFVYYGGDYPANSTPLAPTDVTEVKYIEFTLTIDVDSALAPPATTVRSQVQLRNLKTNLAS